MNASAMNDNSAGAFADIRAMLADAKQRVARGDAVSLDGLDGRIAKLCEAVLALPEDTAKRQVPEFEALWQELEDLQNAMMEARNQVVTEYRELGNVRRAHMAYKTSDSIDGRMIGPAPDSKDD